MTVYDLKPCPFCGAVPEMRCASGSVYFVKCPHCGARTRDHAENPNGALYHWNIRSAAAEVGFCRTCIHFQTFADGTHRCARTSRMTAPADFCSRHESSRQINAG